MCVGGEHEVGGVRCGGQPGFGAVAVGGGDGHARLWVVERSIAEALAELMSSGARQDPDLRDAADRLREAVGLEGRH
jgi:hypothetical protein